MSLKAIIAVAHHKRGIILKNDLFLPIHVGAEQATFDLGIQKDCEGDNISHLNLYYCELTAIYYLWKNRPDYDYYGLCHYRRFLTFRKLSFLNKLFHSCCFFGSKFLHIWKYSARFTNEPYIPCSEVALEKEIENFQNSLMESVKQNSSKFYCSKEVSLSTRTVYEHFSIICGFQRVDEVKSIIRQYYPDYVDVMEKVMAGHKFHSANLFIFPKDMFERYATFVFDVLKKHYDMSVGDAKAISNRLYNRMSGYYAEFLTDIFIRKEMESGRSCCELPILYLMSAEEESNKRGEKWFSALMSMGIFNVNFLR